jgi:hypothetical protein
MRLTSYGAATKLASIPSVFRAGDRVVENSILQFLAQPRCAIRAHRPLGALATILYWRSSTGGWHRPRSGIIAKPSPRKGVAIQRRPSNRSSLNRDPILPFRAGLRPLTDQKGPKTRHRRGRPSAAASRDLARPSPRKAFDTRPVVAVGLAFLAGSNFMDILGTPLADIPAFTRSAAKSRSKSREPDNCSTHFGRSGEAASWADEAQIAAACGLPVLGADAHPMRRRAVEEREAIRTFLPPIIRELARSSLAARPSLALRQPHASTAAVVGDELDASRFKGTLD